MSAHPFHPVSELFPLMTGAPFDELVADIKANGLRESIWRHEGKIIDGRNRYLACEKAGVEPTYREWDGNGELVKFVVSLNLHRRHLDESQRAMIAARLSADSPNGRTKAADDRDEKAGAGIPAPRHTTCDAAEMFKVNRGTVQLAKRVQRDCTPEIIREVDEGRMTLHMASKVANLPRDKQKTEMARIKLLKGKRNQHTDERQIVKHSNGKSNGAEVKLSIYKTDPASAAAMLAEHLDAEYLQELVKEISAILARRATAIKIGLAPSR